LLQPQSCTIPRVGANVMGGPEITAGSLPHQRFVPREYTGASPEGGECGTMVNWGRALLHRRQFLAGVGAPPSTAPRRSQGVSASELSVSNSPTNSHLPPRRLPCIDVRFRSLAQPRSCVTYGSAAEVRRRRVWCGMGTTSLGRWMASERRRSYQWIPLRRYKSKSSMRHPTV
jgi:hypothetical protein